MHIWPSIKVRDSFKVGYLSNLEWNLQRMKSEKLKTSHTQAQLLLNKRVVDEDNDDDDDENIDGWSWSVLCRDILWVFTCCFCLGVCEDVEDVI